MTEKTRCRNKAGRPLEIVQAALTCFLDKGYRDTTFADIANKADIARSTVYLYYKTKPEVFRAVIKFLFTRQRSKIDDRLLTSETDFLSRILAIEKIQIDWCKTDYFPDLVLMLLSESNKNKELADIWYEETFANIKKIWDRICFDQNFSYEKSQALFAMLLSPFLLSSAFSSIFKDKNPLPKFEGYLTTFNQILPAIIKEFEKR